MNIARIAALAAALAFLFTGCGGPPPLPTQTSPADLARQAQTPIQVSPFVAALYRDKYLAGLDASTSGVAVISATGNRMELRFCKHPDCQMSDDEIATRALDRCNLGFARKDPGQRCLVFDSNGKIVQPHRFWTDADFAMPANPPPRLAVTDPRELADTKSLGDRYVVMTPDGQLSINLHADGTAGFWDAGDFFHQGTWSLKDGAVCVNAVDGRTVVTCGTLYGSDPKKITGIVLDLFPGRYLPVERWKIIVTPVPTAVPVAPQ